MKNKFQLKEQILEILDSRAERHRNDGSMTRLLSDQYNYVADKIIKLLSQFLPLWKECPDCFGHGYYIQKYNRPGGIPGHKQQPCPKCDHGKIWIYYTPEQYLTAMRKIDPEYNLPAEYVIYGLSDALTEDGSESWSLCTSNSQLVEDLKTSGIMYHPNQPKPPADYRL